MCLRHRSRDERWFGKADLYSVSSKSFLSVLVLRTVSEATPALIFSYRLSISCRDEDFDVEHPIEIDDIYLNNPSSSIAQPAGKPSLISGFNCQLRLSQIIGRCLRTVYAIGKAKVTRGFVGEHWDQFIVAEVSSARRLPRQGVLSDSNLDFPLIFAPSFPLSD